MGKEVGRDSNDPNGPEQSAKNSDKLYKRFPMGQLPQREMSGLLRVMEGSGLTREIVVAGSLYEITVDRGSVTQLTISQGDDSQGEGIDIPGMGKGKGKFVSSDLEEIAILDGAKGKGKGVGLGTTDELRYLVYPTSKIRLSPEQEKPRTPYTLVETQSNMVIPVQNGEFFRSAGIKASGEKVVIPLLVVAKSPDDSLINKLVKKQTPNLIVWVYPGFVVADVTKAAP